MPPIAVSRPLLFGLVAVGALAAIVTPPPTSSFAAGFAVGAGFVFVISFVKNPRPGRADERSGPRSGEDER